MIEHLSARLTAGGLDPTLSELRDALWLLQHLVTPENRAAPADGADAGEAAAEEAAAGAKPVPENVVTDERTAADAYGEMYATSAGAGRGLRGVAVRSPGVLALPGQLELARALRSFGRRVPSRRAFDVDEDATAAQVAEEGLWAPVLRPAPERWLSLTLVVDVAPSMVVWQRTVRELHNLCAWLGAFQRIRVRSFDSSAPGVLPDPLHDLESIRQAVVVLTDGVGASWRDGRAVSLLHSWGGVAPTAVVTVLPQRMWSGTGLRARAVQVVVPRPAAPNAEWRCGTSDAVAVPVFELSPRWLARWARLTTGAATSRRVALLTTPGPDRDATTESPATANGLVRRFRSVSSPEAFRLATYLSATWPTLPVMRLVQRVMLPESGIAHLAEVFLGGLLQQRGQQGTDPEAVEYEFAPEVRAELSSHLLRDDALTVLRETSEFVSERLGQPFDFAAMLADPEGVELPAVGADGGSPMARIAAGVLTRLGGRYRTLAGRLTAVREVPPQPGRSARGAAGSEPARPAGETRYTADDLWISRIDARLFRVGLTAAGTESFGLLSTKEVGSGFTVGADIGAVRTPFGVRRIRLPVDGLLFAVNHSASMLEDTPAGEPDGWVLEFEAHRPGFFEELMSRDAYESHLRQSRFGARTEFTQELRRLRAAAGNPSYREIADHSHHSITQVGGLFAGSTPSPAWKLVRSVVIACSGLLASRADAAELADERRWRRLHGKLFGRTDAEQHLWTGRMAILQVRDSGTPEPDVAAGAAHLRVLEDVARRAFAQVGLPWEEVVVQRGDDGFIVGLPEGVEFPVVGDALPQALAHELRQRTARLPDGEEIGVRMVLHAADAEPHHPSLGHRLLDVRWPGTADAAATVVVVVSDDFRRAAKQYGAADLTAYERVDVDFEGSGHQAWIRRFERSDDPASPPGALVFCELDGFARSDDLLQRDLQETMGRCLDRAGERVGLDRSTWQRRVGRGGERAVLPPGTPPEVVVDQYVRAVNTELRSVNAYRLPYTRLRMRMSIHLGDVPAGNVPRGRDTAVAEELLCARVSRSALESTGTTLAVVLSDAVYRTVVRARPAVLRSAKLRRVEVRLDDVEEPGWLWLPDDNPPAAQEEKAPSSEIFLQGAPRVFVSYTSDSVEHRALVRQFAGLLRSRGADVVLDQWVDADRRDWSKWVIDQMTQARFVVVIASPGYREAARDAEGRGRSLEAAVVREMVSRDSADRSGHVFPVVLPGGSVDDIPLFLLPHSSNYYRLPELTVEAADGLLRALADQSSASPSE